MMDKEKLYRIVYTAFGDIENSIVCQIVGETKKYVIINTNIQEKVGMFGEMKLRVV